MYMYIRMLIHQYSDSDHSIDSEVEQASDDDVVVVGSTVESAGSAGALSKKTSKRLSTKAVQRGKCIGT